VSQDDPAEHPTPSEAIEAGLYYFAREDYLAARKWWEYAVAIDPHNTRVHECLRILGKTVGEDPGTGDVRVHNSAPDVDVDVDMGDDDMGTPPPAYAQPSRSVNDRATAPAPHSHAAAMDEWTRPSTRPPPAQKAPAGALDAWSRPSVPPQRASVPPAASSRPEGSFRQPAQAIPVAPRAAIGGQYPSMPSPHRPMAAATSDLKPGALEFDPLGFEAAWEGIEGSQSGVAKAEASPADRWTRPSQPAPRAPPGSWDPGQQLQIDAPIGVEAKRKLTKSDGNIQVSSGDPEWEAMMRQIAAGGLVTGPEGLALLDPLGAEAKRGKPGKLPSSAELERPFPVKLPDQTIREVARDPFDDSFDVVSEPPPPERPHMPITRGAKSSVPPSVFSTPANAIPEARTFDLSHEDRENASSPGWDEPSAEEIMGESSPRAQPTSAPAGDADDFELNVEDPEEAIAIEQPNAIDFALSAFETASDPAVFSVAPAANTPWDFGPAESSAMTLSQDVDVQAVAEYTPLPHLDRTPLSQHAVPPVAQPSPSIPPRNPSKPVMRTDGTQPGRISAAASGHDPAAVLERARSRLLLHDFDGALELLESIPTNHPIYEDAKDVLADTRAHLESIYASKIGPFDSSPRVLLSGQQLIWLNLNHRAGFILSQIDGMVSYEDLVSLSGMPRLDTLRILCTLLQEGVIGA